MYLIAGLGNPGKEYDNTRHNIGYALIDKLSEQHQISVGSIQHRALTGKGMIAGQKVLLVKPLTFMNLSGESIRALADYYKIDIETELVVISDDISLAPGQIRIRKRGSAGGHNGLKNIIAQLGREDFQRIRIGVGEKPAGYDLVDYVLGHFTKEEQALMQEGLDKVAEALLLLLSGEIDKAMNQFNRKGTTDSGRMPDEQVTERD